MQAHSSATGVRHVYQWGGNRTAQPSQIYHVAWLVASGFANGLLEETEPAHGLVGRAVLCLKFAKVEGTLICQSRCRMGAAGRRASAFSGRGAAERWKKESGRCADKRLPKAKQRKRFHDPIGRSRSDSCRHDQYAICCPHSHV